MNKFIHQDRYAARQKAKKGHVQVKVWVPEDNRAELIAFAATLRNPRSQTRSQTPDIIAV